MSTREDLRRFRELNAVFSAIGLEQAENVAYFCTPVDAEYVGWLGCDGIHFILLPGDERVFCVDPAMGEVGTYVLPVAADFQEFLSYVLFCRDANPLSQIWWLDEERFRELLRSDAEARWEGCEAYFEEKASALKLIAETFGLTSKEPYEAVRVLQADFDPSSIAFSEEYYEVLGMEYPGAAESEG